MSAVATTSTPLPVGTWHVDANAISADGSVQVTGALRIRDSVLRAQAPAAATLVRA